MAEENEREPKASNYTEILMSSDEPGDRKIVCDGSSPTYVDLPTGVYLINGIRVEGPGRFKVVVGDDGRVESINNTALPGPSLHPVPAKRQDNPTNAKGRTNESHSQQK